MSFLYFGDPVSSREILKPFVEKGTLGKGSCGKVKLISHWVTKEQYALKIITKHPFSQEKESYEQSNKEQEYLKRLAREISAVSLVRHRHIIQLKEVKQSPSRFYLFFEYFPGESLYERLVRNGRMKNKVCRKVFSQLVHAIAYCHKMKIVHRDIKAENVLIGKQDNIKLIDFGFARLWSSEDLMRTSCGSPHYAAPEIVNDRCYQGPEVDIWSLGVLLYVMFCAKHPFNSPSIQELFEQITKGDVKIPSIIPKEPAFLIQSMLTVDRIKRPSIYQILSSSWIHPDISEGPITHLYEEFGMDSEDDLLDSSISLPALQSMYEYNFGQVLAPPSILLEKLRNRLVRQPRFDQAKRIMDHHHHEHLLLLQHKHKETKSRLAQEHQNEAFNVASEWEANLYALVKRKLSLDKKSSHGEEEHSHQENVRLLGHGESQTQLLHATGDGHSSGSEDIAMAAEASPLVPQQEPTEWYGGPSGYRDGEGMEPTQSQKALSWYPLKQFHPKWASPPAREIPKPNPPPRLFSPRKLFKTKFYPNTSSESLLDRIRVYMALNGFDYEENTPSFSFFSHHLVVVTIPAVAAAAGTILNGMESGSKPPPHCFPTTRYERCSFCIRLYKHPFLNRLGVYVEFKGGSKNQFKKVVQSVHKSL